MKSVSIITRTKNRPITLKRVLNSIASQTFKDFQWIIVNDGGDIYEINIIAQLAIDLKIETLVIHNKKSLGMEACSNLGIINSNSKYIAFLDDDDTWHPDFLSKTIKFLNNPKNINYKGVFTNTVIINEILLYNELLPIYSYPFALNLESITLFHLAKRNFVANLSLVYHRDVLETIGMYREDYLVVGDWEFNLRLFKNFDIGFIPAALANYHRRINNDSGPYMQSDKQHQFSQYCSKLRNELLKKDLENNSIGIGFAVNIAYELNQLERSIKRGSIFFITKTIIIVIFRKILLYYKIARSFPFLFLKRKNTNS